MEKTGQYIYAIIATNKEKSYGPIGIWKDKPEVRTVCCGDIGAVISDSPIMEYPVSRVYLMSHQNVLEETMKDAAVLPVRFGTIAESVDLVKNKVLKSRQDEIANKFNYLKDKMEIGIKAFWKNMEPVYQEIAEKDKEIKKLRVALESKKKKNQNLLMRMGEMVKNKLDHNRKQLENSILVCFKGLWVEKKLNNKFGDQMITNASFLISKQNEKAFDDKIEELIDTYKENVKFRYIGPAPPSNFVELVISF